MLKRLENGEIYFGEAKWTPGGTISCLVQVEATDEVIPFNATPYDEEEYGRELFEMLSNKYADQVEVCTQEEKDADQEFYIRHTRDSLLKDSDWVTSSDVQLENQDEWLAYRQALRDLTDHPDFPYITEIPVAPAATTNVYVLPEGLPAPKPQNID